MGLADRVDQDLRRALREGDATRLATLRLLKADAQMAEKAGPGPLSEDEYAAVVRRQAKMRRDAAAEYERAGRPQLAEQERLELALLEEYMPVQLGADQITVVVEQAIAATEAQGPQDLGKVMSQAMQTLRGQADGAAVNRIARELLAAQAR